MTRLFASLPLSVVGLALFLGCSASKDSGGEVPLGDTGGAGDTATTGDTSITPRPDGGDEGGLIVPDALPPTDGSSSCATGDCDKDGYAGSADCNDLDGTINPEAYDFEGDDTDNDCDGTKDNPVTSCPPTDLASKDAMQFARAGDLCAQRSKTKAGAVFDPLTKAEWLSSKAGGGLSTSSTIVAGLNHAGAVKMLAGFGENAARFGGSLFVLETGAALENDPRKGTPLDGTLFPALVANACTAIPLATDDCKSLSNGSLAGSVGVQDYTEIKLTVRVPSNAQAMIFDFAFFSTEFNEYWHSQFNDAFFALATTKAFKNLNVAKDITGGAVTVNSGFFQLCPKPPGPAGIEMAAALANCVGVDGDDAKKIFGKLKGTFFDGSGAGSTDDTIMSPPPPPASGGDKKYIYGGGSGWLTTKFGVEPGETMTLRFMVMDTGDGALDSAAIIDHITWEKAPPKTATGEVDRPPR
ncbi:MAG: choice-of-anchor L domain-containing protein [Polyangiales bacterium]